MEELLSNLKCKITHPTNMKDLQVTGIFQDLFNKSSGVSRGRCFLPSMSSIRFHSNGLRYPGDHKANCRTVPIKRIDSNAQQSTYSEKVNQAELNLFCPIFLTNFQLLDVFQLTILWKSSVESNTRIGTNKAM